MDKLDLYKCETCGNVVEVLVNGGGELYCCGKPMVKVEAQSLENSIEEKHVPIFIDKDEYTTEIRVGEVLHPMTKEHHIVFIQAISSDKNYSTIKFLAVDEEPKFLLQGNKKYSYAREFCNIHGLWEGNNND